MRVDVAIIGTGPGGGMAACRLAETGLKTLILEKEKLPRDKPCGGAISIDVKQFFKWDISPLIEAEAGTLKYVHNNTAPTVIDRFQSPILLVERRHFDYDLIKRALSLGSGNVNLWEKFRVVNVAEDEGAVFISGDNQEHVQADYLIAADGPLSRTAKCLGLERDAPYALAIEAQVAVEPEIFEIEKACATFDFSCVPDGYGWIFPRSGYLNCGVGAWYGRSRPSLRKAMNAFLKKSFPAGSIRSTKQRGHAVPIYAGHRNIATPRVCLVGDAASLVSPWLGEGIRYALQSGLLAAEVIAAILGEVSILTSDSGPRQPVLRNASCRVYQSLIHRTIAKQMDMFYRRVLQVSSN